jgi:sugar (pentulose or hexulose) kinase
VTAARPALWRKRWRSRVKQIYRRSGIQFLPFNTLYQLRALVEQQPELLPQVAHALIPDYFSFRLTGKMNWEYTMPPPPS